MHLYEYCKRLPKSGCPQKRDFGAFKGTSFWVSGVESPLIFYKKKKKMLKIHNQNTSLSLIE